MEEFWKTWKALIWVPQIPSHVTLSLSVSHSFGQAKDGNSEMSCGSLWHPSWSTWVSAHATALPKRVSPQIPEQPSTPSSFDLVDLVGNFSRKPLLSSLLKLQLPAHNIHLFILPSPAWFPPAYPLTQCFPKGGNPIPDRGHWNDSRREVSSH